MAQETGQDEFVSIQELVEICGLSDSTLYRLAKSNRLPGASWESAGVLNRDNSSGLLMPRYQWTIHLETFMTWWTKHLQSKREANDARLNLKDFPQTVERETPTSEAKRLPRPRVAPDVKKYITMLREARFTAIQIETSMKGVYTKVPSLSAIRKIAQEWDDENGLPHLETKRYRRTTEWYANLIKEQESKPAATEFTSSEFIQEVQTYEHNIGDMVRMSNATHYICSECKKGRRNPERLSLSVVRPGRSEQKDVVTHLLCSAICAIKFIEEKEEKEWNETTLQRLEPRQQEITFPLPETAPPKKSQTGSLWRRFRDLVAGKG